jgi:hypothetical protein
MENAGFCFSDKSARRKAKGAMSASGLSPRFLSMR